MLMDEVLDPEVVANLRRAQEAYGNPSFVRQLAELFETNTPGKMDRLRAAFAAGDAHAIEHVAHTLKTNCAMLGATRTAEAFARLEAAAGRADLAAAAAALQDAEQQLPSVLDAVSRL